MYTTTYMVWKLLTADSCKLVLCLCAYNNLYGLKTHDSWELTAVIYCSLYAFTSTSMFWKLLIADSCKLLLSVLAWDLQTAVNYCSLSVYAYTSTSIVWELLTADSCKLKIQNVYQLDRRSTCYGQSSSLMCSRCQFHKHFTHVTYVRSKIS